MCIVDGKNKTHQLRTLNTLARTWNIQRLKLATTWKEPDAGKSSKTSDLKDVLVQALVARFLIPHSLPCRLVHIHCVLDPFPYLSSLLKMQLRELHEMHSTGAHLEGMRYEGYIMKTWSFPRRKVAGHFYLLGASRPQPICDHHPWTLNFSPRANN